MFSKHGGSLKELTRWAHEIFLTFLAQHAVSAALCLMMTSCLQLMLVILVPFIYSVDVPRHNRSTLGHQSFSVAGPTIWNSLSDELRDQGCTESTFKQSLKTYLFSQH